MARGEGIKRVADLFEVYRNRLRPPQESVISEFIEVADEVLGIKLPEKGISYSPGSKTLSLSLPGTMKTEVLLRKEELLAHLKGRMGVRHAPKDII